MLDGAHLESCKTGKEFSLLNIDEHRGLLSRSEFVPPMKIKFWMTSEPGFLTGTGETFPVQGHITHQSLLMLFDSPLNRAVLLQVQ